MPCLQEAAAAIQKEAVAANGVESSLQLDFQQDAAHGRTVLAASRQEPPLRVVRAFTLADGSALVHLHNVSGGLLGGDRLRLGVKVGQGARAQITTTGATRIYRPRHLVADTTQFNEVEVAGDGLLEYVPDPLIPFAHTRYRQRTIIRLQPGAGLFWWEVLAPGREAAGEVFAYERLEVKLEIWAQDRLVAAECSRLQPDARLPGSLARLGPYRYWASFYICRVGLEQKFWTTAEQHLREAASGLSEPGMMLWGISTLPAHGLALRFLARHGHDVIPSLQKLWCVAKRQLYGCAAIPPRKVN